MTRQNIGIGSSANDGTGDTLRAAGQKINENFVDLYLKLGGDSDILSSQISLTSNAVVFEGASADIHETSLVVAEPTADRTITLPDVTGTVSLIANIETLTNKTLTSPVLTTPQINDTSADHQYIFAPSELTADRTITLPLLTGNDTFVFAAHTATLTNKTLTTPILVQPRIDGHITDSSGAILVDFTSVASAVNYIELTNAATGQIPEIHAIGSDANIDLSFSAKGTGSIHIGSRFTFEAEELTSSGAISLATPLTIFNSGAALAMTLADGAARGEVKEFINEGAGLATITPVSFSNGTTWSMRENSACAAIWSGDNWHLKIDKNWDSSDADALVFVTA